LEVAGRINIGTEVERINKKLEAANARKKKSEAIIAGRGTIRRAMTRRRREGRS
jgi:hypothetical protein